MPTWPPQGNYNMALLNLYCVLCSRANWTVFECVYVSDRKRTRERKRRACQLCCHLLPQVICLQMENSFNMYSFHVYSQKMDRLTNHNVSCKIMALHWQNHLCPRYICCVNYVILSLFLNLKHMFSISVLTIFHLYTVAQVQKHNKIGQNTQQQNKRCIFYNIVVFHFSFFFCFWSNYAGEKKHFCANPLNSLIYFLLVYALLPKPEQDSLRSDMLGSPAQNSVQLWNWI